MILTEKEKTRRESQNTNEVCSCDCRSRRWKQYQRRRAHEKLPGRASFFCTFAGTLKPRTRIRVDALQSVDLIRYSNHSDASDTPVDNWRELEWRMSSYWTRRKREDSAVRMPAGWCPVVPERLAGWALPASHALALESCSVGPAALLVRRTVRTPMGFLLVAFPFCHSRKTRCSCRRASWLEFLKR